MNGESSSRSMEKPVEKFIWLTKKFPASLSRIYSDIFVFDSRKCRFVVCRDGESDDYLLLFLEVAHSSGYGWGTRQEKFSFTLVNQPSGKAFKFPESQHRKIGDDQNIPNSGFQSIFPLGRFKTQNGGFLVNGQVTFILGVNALEVICVLEKSEVSEEASNFLETEKQNDNSAVSIDVRKETFFVNGVQVLPSQMETVSCIFEKYPDVASEFRSKNPHLRTGYMNVLLSIIQKLSQSPKELSGDDLYDAGDALVFMKGAGFKLDWLDKKLDEVKEKKKKEEACLARLQEIEEQFKPLKQKWLELQAQMDKEKAELLKARAPLSLDHLRS